MSVPIYLKDYQPSPYIINQVQLIFELDLQQTRVKSVMHIQRRHNASKTVPLCLNGVNLQLQSVSLNQQLLDNGQYQVTDEALIITERLADDFVLTTDLIITPKLNTALEGLYVSNAMLCTQCEAEGFRRITYFLDRPDNMAVYRTTIIADRQQFPVMLANGNLVEQGEYDEYRHFVTWHDPFPKPSYLFALVAGRLVKHEDQFVTMSNKTVALQLWIEAENRHKTSYALQALKRAMRWDELRYGREYDLNLLMLVAVNDFNMGAMENKGLNIFNSAAILANPDTTTDNGYLRIEGVIGHEYFHNWSGDRVTCRDWFQLSLKEGFTVFRDQSFSAEVNRSAAKRIQDVILLRTIQFAEDNGPTSHPVQPTSFIEIGNFYTVTIYEKGAEIVRMLAHLLGDKKFRQATDLYFARFDGQAVTIEDFVAVMAEVSGQNLQQFMYWYTQAGTPTIQVLSQFQPACRSWTLKLTQYLADSPGQNAADKQMQVIPIRMGLLNQQGMPLDLVIDGKTLGQETVLTLRQAEQSWTFENIPQMPIPSLLRGFSAPVKLHYNYSHAELLTLIKFDSDIFNRWDACQTLVVQMIDYNLLAYSQQQAIQADAVLIDLYRYLITHEHPDYEVLALMLRLPSEAYIAQQQKIVDIDAIHFVRQTMLEEIGRVLFSEWLSLYQNNQSNEAYAPTPIQMARRSIKNCALQFLAASENDNALALVWQQFNQATNMTDCYAALNCLVQSSQTQRREQALTQFEQKWQQDPLMMDQWFSVQALRSQPDVIETVKKLLRHPQFSLTNPNRVRALIGTFSQVNRVNFHRLDGAGYQLLTPIVQQLDQLNPEIAARLLAPLLQYHQLDVERQMLIKEQLMILKSSCQSKHVTELLIKALT